MAGSDYASGNPAPATRHAAVTPGTAFGQARALYVGTGGSVVVRDLDGTDVTYANVSNGQVLDIQCKMVVSAGTTASNIVAWF